MQHEFGPLQVLTGHKLAGPLERLLVRRYALSTDLCEAVLQHVRDPAFVWTTTRHDEHPTTDAEVDSIGWLDECLSAPGGLVDVLLDDLSRGFGVPRSCLWLREMFIVKYEAARPNSQRGLETHRDASFFSFVVALSAPDEYEGGGTTWAVAPRCPALRLPSGDAVSFVGQHRHRGVPISAGTRFVLTGFVDARVPLAQAERLGAKMRASDSSFVISVCRELPRPWQRHTVRALERAARGRRRRALVEALAARRVCVPHVELGPLEEGCRAFLSGRPTGEQTRRFVSRVLAMRDESPIRH